MRITILTLGTRGDVQPYMALGLGLQQAGHSVTLATSRDFQTAVGAVGLRFAAFRFSIQGILNDPDNRAAFVSKRAALRLYRKVAPQMPDLLQDAWTASHDAQLLLFHPKIVNALDIAEKLDIPAMLAFYLPAFSPTRAFPAPFIPGPASWGGLYNKVSHHLFLGLMTAPYHRMTNRWRVQTLQLPPRPWTTQGTARYGRSLPKLYGYSTHLVPTPLDWDTSAHVTGHWFLPAPGDYQPPADLSGFLAAGPPPVCIGFGSIAGHEPARTTAVVLQALQAAGQRGVIVTGWGGLPVPEEPPPTVHFVKEIPYEWLLPRVSAVVHHGGAGSTVEGLRAGKPTVICPFIGDQFFWGRRVSGLGVGPLPVPAKNLSASALTEAIRAVVHDHAMRHRASILGERIRAEQGVQNAVQVIQKELDNCGAARARKP